MSSASHSHKRVHRAIICVDIESFCRPGRNDAQRADMRRGLYDVLERAFTWAGIDANDRYHEDRGDGAFFLVPTEGPQSRLVEPLPFHLASELARYNQAASPATRVRLRVALHAGYVHHDPRGVVGTALNEAFRLLDAPVLKRTLHDASGDLAFIASDQFHQDVIRSRRVFDSSADRKVRVTVKDPHVEAWICTFSEQDEAGRRYQDALGRVRAALASVDTTLRKAKDVRDATVQKVSSPVPEVPDVGLGELRDRLTEIDEPRERHRWARLLAGAAELERAAATALEQAGAALADVQGPLDVREELRGRLGSLQVMARNLGRAEDARLDGLYRSAHELLWTAPCDLDAAESAVLRYIQEIQDG
ncbi:hypothetical protein D0T12_03435 [Actinomadura spongiicola]|uniref:Guanylate cyclase domain-containing protein n=1 Tax=Actinomadura spongiicola TaxID=2303421 RepID=A0A372GQ79_9ACTN|nr:hypothetical protein [Actinomadura spongiicola]RFS87302.1 hypothetical protein D0T12_03435 [Actinomadura spongiicola]